MAIWLYYTKKGNLAKIQHGEVLRQGSSFKIIYAFEDKDIILNKSLTVAFKKPGGEITPFYPVGKFTEQDLLSSTSRIRFNKIKSTEMTYGLQDNVEYYCLTGNYDPAITEKYGTLTVITKISTQDGEIDNEEQDDTVYFQGSVQLYVEPTYGKQPESSNVSLDQYNALVEHINDVVANKVNVENGLVKNLKVSEKLNATGEEIDSSLPNGIYVNEPTENKQVANKEYVDKISEKLDDKVDKLDGEATNLKLKGTTYANFENSKLLVNTPNENSDEQQVVNRAYADTKVKGDGGTAKNLTLEGNIKANGSGTYLEINEAKSENNPITKKHFDDKIGNLNELESFAELEKVNIVSAINNATTKKEVADLLLKYVFVDDTDEDFAPLEEINLTYVYMAERAVSDENGENIAANISNLKSLTNNFATTSNVNNLIVSHNISSNAHSDIVNALNKKIEDDIKAAIDGLIGGATGTYDTLKEIEEFLKDNDNNISNILTTLSGKASITQLEEAEESIKSFVENKNYLTEITSSQITDALGFTPYNSTNPNGYITASADITGTAANATKLNNQDASYYATQDDIKDFVSVSVVDDVIIIG